MPFPAATNLRPPAIRAAAARADCPTFDPNDLDTNINSAVFPGLQSSVILNAVAA